MFSEFKFQDKRLRGIKLRRKRFVFFHCLKWGTATPLLTLTLILLLLLPMHAIVCYGCHYHRMARSNTIINAYLAEFV